MNSHFHQNYGKIVLFWGRLTLCLAAIVLLAACGNSEPTPEPTPTAVPLATVAPIATTQAPTTAPTTAPQATEPPSSQNAQSESPLAQPASPLAQPASPLSTTTTSRPNTIAEAQAIADNTKAPQPKPGFGTVSGMLFSTGTLQGGIMGTKVYLEKADEYNGTFSPLPVSVGPQAGDVVTESNNLGQFQLEVPPGHYYLSVWAPYNWLLASSDEKETEPLLVTVEDGKPLDLGLLYLQWP